MSKTPKVSIILPFFNAANTIEMAIMSIINQSFTDFECILINNNSTDNSQAIASSFAKTDNRFKLITENKKGVVFASNAGWKMSRGKYVARMDADDWAHPNKIKLQNDYLDKNAEIGVVATQVKHISHSEYTGGMAKFVDWSNSINTCKEIINNQFIEMPIVNPTAMWRRETALQNGMYLHGDFPEDYEMWLRWLNAGVKIAKLESKLLNWHDSDGRLSRTDPIYSDSSFYKIKTKYLAIWLEKHNPFHPYVTVWGASRISRKRAKLLEKYGIIICCYIDTKKNRQLDHQVYYFEDIPSPDEIFVLTYIKQKEAREEIREFLPQKGFVEGKHFMLIS